MIENQTSSDSSDYSEALDFLDDDRVIAAFPERVRGKSAFFSPISVEIHPTNECQLGCRFCYYKTRNKNEAIPRNVITRLISDLRFLQVKTIVISGGGDPLLYPYIEEVLDLISSARMQTGLNTNGLEINKSIARRVLECSWIKISLDASTPARYSIIKNCPKAVFQKVLSNIALLLEMRNESNSSLRIQLGFVINKWNWDQTISFLKKFENWPLDPRKDSILFRPVVGKSYDIKLSKIKNLICQNMEFLRGYSFPNSLVFYPQRRSKITAIPNPRECKATSFMSCVAADSCVYPCCQLVLNNDYALGSLKDMTFSEIWNGSLYSSIRNSMDIKSHPPCKYRNINQVLEQVDSCGINSLSQSPSAIAEKWRERPIFI